MIDALPILRQLSLPNLRVLWCALDFEAPDAIDILGRHIDISSVTEIALGCRQRYPSITGYLGCRISSDQCCHLGTLGIPWTYVGAPEDPRIQFGIQMADRTIDGCDKYNGFVKRILDGVGSLQRLALRYPEDKTMDRYGSSWHVQILHHILPLVTSKAVDSLVVEFGRNVPQLVDILAATPLFSSLENLALSHPKKGPKFKGSLWKSLSEAIKTRANDVPRKLKLHLQRYPPIPKRFLKELNESEVEFVESHVSIPLGVFT